MEKKGISRKIVVTGANRGIGFALTNELLSRGHFVIASYRDLITSDSLLDLTKKHKNLEVLPLDVCSDISVEIFANSLAKHEVIDVLINNAGMMGDQAGSLTETTGAKVLETLNTNAVGTVRITKALLPLLERAGEPRCAQISSQMGSINDNSSGGYYGYRMSKCAVNMFNKSLSQDYPRMICLTLHPGWVKTDMGGAQAPVDPAFSAKGLADVILNSTIDHSGSFMNYKGEELEW